MSTTVPGRKFLALAPIRRRRRDASLSGAASVLDLGGVLRARVRALPRSKSDVEALREDWERVGLDMRTAIGFVREAAKGLAGTRRG